MIDNWGRSLWDRTRAELLHKQSLKMLDDLEYNVLSEAAKRKLRGDPYVPAQCQACGARYTLTKRGVHVCGYCGSEK